jgi:hypothetical protein
MCKMLFLCKSGSNYTASVHKVYNLTDIRIQRNFFTFKKVKIFDIVIPHQMNKLAYKFALDDINNYILGKTFIVKEDKGYVYLYRDKYYINNCINNIIFSNYMIYSS